MIAFTVTVEPGATAAGRAVRRPSHTYTFPLAAYRWYERLTAPGCHVREPLFVTVTETVVIVLSAAPKVGAL